MKTIVEGFLKYLKKLSLYFLISVILLANFAAFFIPKTAKAAPKIIDVTSNPSFATVSGTKTIKGDWTIDVGKYQKETLGQNPIIDASIIEFKFIVTIDGKAICQMVSGGPDDLSTTSTVYGIANYNSYDGKVVRTRTIDESVPFGIFGSFDSNNLATFTLIDNLTVPSIDKGTAKTHTYTIQPMWKIPGPYALDRAISADTKSGVFNPGTTTDSVKTKAWYEEHYFNKDHASFVVGDGSTSMSVNGTSSTITIPGKDFGNGNKRPKLVFKLTSIIPYSGPATRDANYFVFVNQDANASNLAIIVSGGYLWRDCAKNVDHGFSAITSAKMADGTQSIDWWTGSMGVDLWFDDPGKKNQMLGKDNVFFKFLDSMYNGGPYGQNPGQPNQCPVDGQLNEEARKILGVDALNIGGTIEPPGSGTCGIVTSGGIGVSKIIGDALNKALCALLISLGNMGKWLIDYVFGSTFDALKPIEHKFADNFQLIGHAHAQIHPSAIKDALNGTDPGAEWVLKSWKVVLGLADVFVAIIIIFLAVINIMHIQYDTYQLKKTLPVLIIGVILANFSILITKMLVDATNVLTSTFVPEGAGTTLRDMITKSLPPNPGANPSGLITIVDTGTLILALIFGFIILIGFIILGFLFYIRYVVILACTVAAPVAFILMSFAPTQAVFKQWWGYYSKFIFMKPVAFFLIWLAGMVIVESGGKGITPWIVAIFLIYAAVIIPFKMGGAISSAWGGLGKKGLGAAGWATGTGKEGYLRKPMDAMIQRKKDRIKTGLGDKFAGTALGKRLDRARAADENAIENSKGLRESKYQSRMGEHMEKNKDKQKIIDREIEQGKNTIENLRMKLKLELESGDLGNISDRAIASITGQKGATQASTLARYEKQNSDMNDYKNALEKERQEKLVLGSNEKIRHNTIVRSGLKQMAAAGQTVKSQYNIDGTKVAPGAAPVDMNWDDAMDTAEQLDFDATTETDETKRQAKLDAANHIRSQANAFRQKNQTYAAGTMINGISVAGQAVKYDDYLSRNLAGRQMKTEAPFIADEGKTIQMSSDHKTIINDTRKDFGTGRFRSNKVKFNKALVGKGHEVDSGASVANQAQLRATALNLTSMDRGDVVGVQSAQDLMTRVDEARAEENLTDPTIIANFRQTCSGTALAKTPDDQRLDVEKDILKQHNKNTGSSYKSYAEMVTAGDKDAALAGFDISKEDCNSSAPEAAARRAYLDSLKTVLMTDATLGLSGNPAAMAAQVQVP